MALRGWAETARAAPPQLARPAVALLSRPLPPTAARTAAAVAWVHARRAGRRAQPAATACSAAGSGSLGGGGDSLDRDVSSNSVSAAAAFLAQQDGLDPAQLQREQPAAFAQLTVPLAKVLAEVHRAREGSKERQLRLAPSELMARICFLHYSAGLQPAEMLPLWRREPRLLHFDRESAAALRDWLCSLELWTQRGKGADGWGPLQQVSTEQLRRLTLVQPQLWSRKLGTVQQNKAAAQQILGLSEADWAAGFLAHPQVTRTTKGALQSTADWLSGLGFSKAAAARLWCTRPHIFAVSAATLEGNLQGLLQRCPLTPPQQRQLVQNGGALLALSDYQKTLARLDRLLEVLPGLGSCLPKLLLHGSGALCLDLDRLLHKISALQAYGFDDRVLTKAIRQIPHILHLCLEEKLQPQLAELERLLGSKEAVVRAVGKGPPLLAMAQDTLKSNEEIMAGHGLSGAEIRACVFKASQVFAWDMASEEMNAKFRYFEEELGRLPRQMLTQYPNYLTYHLYRLDRKRAFMAHKGDQHYKATLSWISWSDAKFCSEYGYGQEEFEAWWPQWLQSETLAKYGIKEPRPAFSRALAARDKGNRAKVAARRQARLAEAIAAEV